MKDILDAILNEAPAAEFAAMDLPDHARTEDRHSSSCGPVHHDVTVLVVIRSLAVRRGSAVVARSCRTCSIS